MASSKFMRAVFVLATAVLIALTAVEAESVYLTLHTKSGYQRWKEGVDTFIRQQRRKNEAQDRLNEKLYSNDGK